MILRLFLLLYSVTWAALLPVVLVYLWRRGRHDPDYRAHLAERFGLYEGSPKSGVMWLHVVSLGETRSAVGLIRLMLTRGDRVLLTHFTPAGRRESLRLFPTEIASGDVTVVWVPFDMAWCYRRFLRHFRPRIGLTLEVEIWPGMIFTCRAEGVPLYLCNGQYASGPLARDSKGLRLRHRVMRGLSGAFVKSSLQAERLRSIGLGNITVTGELRFDQPIPAEQLAAAAMLRPILIAKGEVITIASGVEGEETLFVEMIAKSVADNPAAPLFVYVPRAPERFDAVDAQLRAKGLKVVRRSNALDHTLAAAGPPQDFQVLLGDSLGEMFFYLALSDRVIVGGGFTPRGAHNIIEPLMLGKPALTGPHVWTIEYPFAEAQASGIARSLADRDALLAALAEPMIDQSEAIDAFLVTHSGASARTLAAIDHVLSHPPAG